MLLYFLNQTSCCWSQTSSCQTLNMELPFWKYLPFWKHITWYSEFSTLCKNYVTLVKVWNAIFSWCLPFTKLKCFIEENSMNIGKIPSLYSQNIFSDICKCLWRNWQIFEYLHNRNITNVTNISREKTCNYSNNKNHLHCI